MMKTSEFSKRILREIERQERERKDMMKQEPVPYLQYDKGYIAALFSIKCFIEENSK